MAGPAFSKVGGCGGGECNCGWVYPVLPDTGDRGSVWIRLELGITGFVQLGIILRGDGG